MAAPDWELQLGHAFWSHPDGRFCLQHVRSAEDRLYRPHSHPEYGIVICLRGEVLKAQLGTRQVMGPGEVMMSNSGVDHASGYLGSGAGCEAVCLSVERRVLAPLLADFRLPALTGALSPIFTGRVAHRALLDCAWDAVRELAHPGLGHGLVMEGLATRILVETLRAWPRSGIGQGRVDLRPSLPRREFVRAYEFMRWCRKDAFRLHQLCRVLGSSEERFTRLFRTAAHCTPAQFYNQLLMERARMLLCETGVSVKAAALELGFRTPSHFVAVFRRHYGAPPQEYRARTAGQPSAAALPEWLSNGETPSGPLQIVRHPDMPRG